MTVIVLRKDVKTDMWEIHLLIAECKEAKGFARGALVGQLLAPLIYDE